MSNSRSQSEEEVQRRAGCPVAGGVWFHHARYDGNGNVISGLSGLGGTYAYDVENRMVDNGVEKYGYGAGNRRLWKMTAATSYQWAEVYLYGLRGEVLEVFSARTVLGWGYKLERASSVPTQRAWFGGRLIEKKGTGMTADRLGSYAGTYPYGELQGAAGVAGEKFATYWRDATGLDYGVNRYYSPQMGRFLSGDPYQASGGAGDPGSWNRYAYVGGDPVNYGDPGGLQKQAPGIPYLYQECWGGERAGCTWRVGMTRPSSEPDEERPSPSAHDVAVLIRGNLGDKLTDCEGLASFAANAAINFASTKEEFVRSFGAFVPSEHQMVKLVNFILGGSIASSSDPVYFQPPGGQSGFKTEYQDGLDSSSDQVHHFAAYFQFGFVAGALEAHLAAVATDFNNLGDIHLGVAAANLGQAFKMGVIKAQDLGKKIRDMLCK